jgi:diguanylate cyclase (GGDEF)-like protein
MENKSAKEPVEDKYLQNPVPFSIMTALSVTAVILAFALGGTFASSPWAIAWLLGMVGIFVFVSIGAYEVYGAARRKRFSTGSSEADRSEEHLRALEEASELFSGTLGPSDAFRLISSRIRIMLPAVSSAMLVPEEGRDRLIVIESAGDHAAELRGKSFGLGESVAGQCYYTNIIEVGREALDHGFEPTPTACLPIADKDGPKAIIQLYFPKDLRLVEKEYELLDAIRNRVTPLMISSISIEKNRASAMTDQATGLPNERAFAMIFEKQVAETSRKREIRPLTLLSIDIKDFEQINSRFGHVAGDRVLEYAADVLHENLRQMDVLARVSSDEFLVIAPTATRETAHEMITRINAGFFGRRVKPSVGESIEVEVNIGWSVFGTDGETTDAMIKAARQRRTQAKSGEPAKVVWFPQELSN